MHSPIAWQFKIQAPAPQAAIATESDRLYKGLPAGKSRESRGHHRLPGATVKGEQTFIPAAAFRLRH